MKRAVRDAARTHPPGVGLLCFACYTTHHPSPHRAPCLYDFFRVRASDCVSDLWLSFAAFSDLTNDERFRTTPCMEFSLVHMSACLITLVHSLPGADKGRARGQVFPRARASPIVFEGEHSDVTRWPASMRATSYSALLKTRRLGVDVENRGLVGSGVVLGKGDEDVSSHSSTVSHDLVSARFKPVSVREYNTPLPARTHTYRAAS